MWWFDMGGGWYDDPRMLAAIGGMERLARDLVGVDGRPVAEIAFVVDGKSSAYCRPNNPFGWPALVLQQPQLGRIGAPFAAVHLADLGDLPDYKLYIFANCLAPSDEERRIIRENILARGAAAVWVGPAGVYRDGKLDASGMAALTELDLVLEETQAPFRIAPESAATEWGWTGAESYGQGQKGGVLAVPHGESLLVLGRIDGTDMPGLVAAKRENGGLTVFSSVPWLPSRLLRAVARKAGVHLYIDTDDIVWGCRDLLAVSVNEGGTRTVRLPRRCTVTDLWSGETLAEDADAFELCMESWETALVRLR